MQPPRGPGTWPPAPSRRVSCAPAVAQGDGGCAPRRGVRVQGSSKGATQTFKLFNRHLCWPAHPPHPPPHSAWRAARPDGHLPHRLRRRSGRHRRPAVQGQARLDCDGCAAPANAPAQQPPPPLCTLPVHAPRAAAAQARARATSPAWAARSPLTAPPPPCPATPPAPGTTPRPAQARPWAWSATGSQVRCCWPRLMCGFALGRAAPGVWHARQPRPAHTAAPPPCRARLACRHQERVLPVGHRQEQHRPLPRQHAGASALACGIHVLWRPPLRLPGERAAARAPLRCSSAPPQTAPPLLATHSQTRVNNTGGATPSSCGSTPEGQDITVPFQPYYQATYVCYACQ